MVSLFSTRCRTLVAATLVLAGSASATHAGLGDGFLVASDILGQVRRLNTDGTPIDTLPISGVGELAVGPDGTVYASRFSSNSILKFNPHTGATLGSIAVGGAPRDVIFGPDGLLYVASTGNGSGGGNFGVFRFDPVTGQNLGSFASGTSLSIPIGMAFSASGVLHVSFDTRFGGSPPDSVKRFNGTTGVFIDVFATQGISIPQHVTFAPDGDVLVSNQGTNNVTRYSPAGAFEGAFLTGLSNPQGIYFRPNGNIVVASSSTFREYDGQTGAFLGTFASGFGLASDMVLVPEPACGAVCLIMTALFASRRWR